MKTRAIGAAASATLACMAPPTPAMATMQYYCGTSTYASGASCAGPRHSLRANTAWNAAANSSYYVAVTAYDTNWNQYGSWVYGWGARCHSYSGATLLYPAIGNADSRTQSMFGEMRYGSGEGPCA